MKGRQIIYDSVLQEHGIEPGGVEGFDGGITFEAVMGDCFQRGIIEGVAEFPVLQGAGDKGVLFISLSDLIIRIAAEEVEYQCAQSEHVGGFIDCRAVSIFFRGFQPFGAPIVLTDIIDQISCSI